MVKELARSKENIFLFVPNLIGKLCIVDDYHLAKNKTFFYFHRLYANYLGCLVFILYALAPKGVCEFILYLLFIRRC